MWDRDGGVVNKDYMKEIIINSRLDEDMNKDHLLIKCREVIESLNWEIEEERVAFKIVKEESTN